MRIGVLAAEVATLSAEGKPWDGPGGPRVRKPDLAAFFALDLDGQLGQLAAEGNPPVPPDVFVRIYAGDEVIAETADQKSFDPEWDLDDDNTAELAPGAAIRVEVWDRDVLFHDEIGKLEATVPELVPAGGRWVLGPFGQVRRVVLHLG